MEIFFLFCKNIPLDLNMWNYILMKVKYFSGAQVFRWRYLKIKAVSLSEIYKWPSYYMFFIKK